MQEADADRGDRGDRGDRSDRAQASLREREREVQMSRTRQEKEWDKEKDSLRKAEATELFNAMLVDMVRLVGRPGCVHTWCHQWLTQSVCVARLVSVLLLRGGTVNKPITLYDFMDLA